MIPTHTHPVTGQRIKLGKHPARRDPRTLQLSDYLDFAYLEGERHYNLTAGFPPLVESDWLTGAAPFGMGLNDRLGCCAITGPAHMIQAQSYYARQKFGAGQVIIPSDADIQAAYCAVGGYVPGDPSTDNGCNLLDVLNYWRQTGIAGHKIQGYVAVDPANALEWQFALNAFGGLLSGFALPLSAQAQTAGTWDVPVSGTTGAGAPGSWGGHCAPPGQFDPSLERCVTWAAIQALTRAFWTTYLDELYAVISDPWLAAVNGDELAPSGLDLAALRADIGEIDQTNQDASNFGPVPGPSPARRDQGTKGPRD